MFIVMATMANFSNLLTCYILNFFSLRNWGKVEQRVFCSLDSFTVTVGLSGVRFTLLCFLRSNRWWRSDIITHSFRSSLSSVPKFLCLFQDYLPKYPFNHREGFSKVIKKVWKREVSQRHQEDTSQKMFLGGGADEQCFSSFIIGSSKCCFCLVLFLFGVLGFCFVLFCL